MVTGREVLVCIAAGIHLPLPVRRGKSLQQIQVRLLVAPGFGFTGNRLAEKVEGVLHTPGMQPPGCIQCLADGMPAHEAARQSPQGCAYQRRSDMDRPGRPAVPETPVADTRPGKANIREVFLQVTHQFGIIPECRQDVDETQGLYSKVVILDGTGNQRIQPALLTSTALAGLLKQTCAQLQYAILCCSTIDHLHFTR